MHNKIIGCANYFILHEDESADNKINLHEPTFPMPISWNVISQDRIEFTRGPDAYFLKIPLTFPNCGVFSKQRSIHLNAKTPLLPSTIVPVHPLIPFLP